MTDVTVEAIDQLATLIHEIDDVVGSGVPAHTLAAALLARGVTMPAEPREELPVPRCSYCTRTSADNRRDGFGPLVDVRVIVAESEEGFADVMRLVCNQHLIVVTSRLADAGFTSHKHGGICFLEDTKCPGYTDPILCPTPEPDDG